MKNKRVLLISAFLFIFSLACILNVFAHSGRTDANGGHRDNNNQSGLGSYHYHCGGYPAHLHNNGVCPYKSGGYSSISYSNSSDEYDEGYDDGYDDGYDKGYDAGYDDGYDEGLDDGYDDGYDEGYQDRYEEAVAEREKEFNILMILIAVIVVIALIVKLIKKRREK